MNDFDTVTDATAPVTLPAGPPPTEDDADTLESAQDAPRSARIVDGACTVCDTAIEASGCLCGPVDRNVDPDRFGDVGLPDLLSEFD